MFKYLIIVMILISTITTQSQNDKSGGSLYYGEEIYPKTYDPFSTGENMGSLRISQLIFEPLVNLNEWGEVVPQLAENWTILGKKSIKFKIRDNIKWNDGRKFSSEDVKFTYDALKNPLTKVDYYYKVLADEVEKVNTYGNSVEFIMKESYDDPEELKKYFTKIAIYPSHIFPNGVIDNSIFFNTGFVGTGPYKLRNPTGSEIWLTKNQYYYDNIYINDFYCRITKDTDISVNELKKGEIQMKVTVPTRAIADLQSTGQLRIKSYASLKITAIAVNFKNELLSQKFIRKALLLGTNREKLLQNIYLGYGDLISGPFAPNSSAYNPNILPVEFNKYEAKLNLTNSGCVDSDNDGILEYNNKPLIFNLLIPIDNDKSATISIAEGIKVQLDSIGIKINIERLEQSSFMNRVINKKDFDLALISLAFDENSDVSPLFLKNAHKNFISYDNEEVNNLIKESDKAKDRETKRTINYRLHEVLADDLPYIFLWTLQNNTAYSKKIRNVSIDPFKFFQDVNEWYIDSEYSFK